MSVLGYRKEIFRAGWAKNAPFTSQFVRLCNRLIGSSGVYCFWIEDKDHPIYVGKSDNIGVRIMQSFTDKHCDYQAFDTQVSFLLAEPPDAGILELYFINKFYPILNKRDTSTKKISLQILPIPEFSDGTRVLALERSKYFGGKDDETKCPNCGVSYDHYDDGCEYCVSRKHGIREDGTQWHA